MPPPLPMTPGRRVALAIGVPVALAIIGLTALTIVANVGQASLRVDQAIPAPDHLVRVTIDNPDVTLRSAAGSGAGIRVTGTLRGPFVPPAFRVLPTAAGVAIRSHCVMKIVGSCSGALTLTAPAGLPVTVSDASGHLSASGVHGHVTLSDGSGDLAAARLSGAISLADGSGNITASGLSGGDIAVNDSSGDISVSGVTGGGLTLGDGSGEIVVTGLAETDVVARNGSGDVTLIFTKVPRRVDITDGSGNITLALPPGPAYYRVDASSSSGDRSVSVKTRPSSPYVIAATADSGNVSISYG
jgi:Putative adhesin